MDWIDQQHQLNAPYNILYTACGIYCFARKPQGTYAAADWTEGFAWYELAGAIVLHSQPVFDRLTAQDIEAELAKLRP